LNLNASEEQSSQENNIIIAKESKFSKNSNSEKNRNIAIKEKNISDSYYYSGNYAQTNNNKFLLSQCEQIADKAIDLIFNNVSVN
jgi:hypothetical protein